MSSKASIHVTKSTRVTRTKVSKSGKTKSGTKRCPVCGKYMGRGKLREITNVKDFENLLEQIMLSEEEKQILWMHYKEEKSLLYIADTLGMSETTIKKKHRKILMKIGKAF